MPKQHDDWFVYILRCADHSLYTGITKDLAKRVAEHNGHGKNGARYTRARRPVTLVYQETYASRAQAAQREWTIKQLSAGDKGVMIKRQSDESAQKTHALSVR